MREDAGGWEGESLGREGREDYGDMGGDFRGWMGFRGLWE